MDNNIQVLLVDDETDVLDIMSLRLNRRGMPTTVAASGKEALARLVEQHFDIVLLDVKMPEMDGVTLLKLIKGLYPSLAVIMLSGHADMTMAAQGIQLGAFSYLLKPVDIEALCHKIEDAYEHSKLEQD